MPEPEDVPDHTVALARGLVASRGEGQRRRAKAMRYNPAVVADPAPDRDLAATEESAPRPLPQGVVAGARSIESSSYAPLMMGDPDPSPRKPARSAPPATLDLEKPSASLPPKPERAAVLAEQARPTWGELAFKKQPIPLDESLRKASRYLAVKSASPGAAGGLKPAAQAFAPVAPGRPHWRLVGRSLVSSIPTNVGSSTSGFPMCRGRWSRSAISIPT